jgi:hypothetical protein
VRVGVAPSTVSGHLAKLEAAGLIVIHARGRRREAQLARPEVAEALEALARLATGDARPIGLRAVNRHAALREARSCYDHLAGRAGVALADALVEHGAIVARDGGFELGNATHFQRAFGIEVGALPGRRALVRACVDWTERRAHVAGALGAALLDVALERDWVRRREDGRALNLTAVGRVALLNGAGEPVAPEAPGRGWARFEHPRAAREGRVCRPEPDELAPREARERQVLVDAAFGELAGHRPLGDA